MDDNSKTNLIINYLPQQMTDDEFRDLFEKFGPMNSCKIVRNRGNGNSYGFGFVDFKTNEQALKAIEELNGYSLEDKKIKVAFARPAGQDIKQANLYVKNIPKNWNQDDVRKIFQPYGNIIQVRVLGNNKGVAFVLYDLRKQAEDALKVLNGQVPEGCSAPLEIKFAADKKSNTSSNNSSSNNSNNSNNNNSNRRKQHNKAQNNNNSNNNNNNYNNNNNNSLGPTRKSSSNKNNRFSPFVPMSPALPPASQPINTVTYGFPNQPQMQLQQPLQQPIQQPMMLYNMMQPVIQNPQLMQPQMNMYATPQIGYTPPITQNAMTNIYSVASNNLTNAANMQPQFGQPMAPMRNQSSSTKSHGSSDDGVTLFVYNISPTSDENELREIFEPYGEVVKCNVVRKSPGRETKGFGFVTLRDLSQANAAISGLDGSMRNGRALQVKFKK